VLQEYNESIEWHQAYNDNRRNPLGLSQICYSGDTGRRNFNHQLLNNLHDSEMEIAKNIIKNGQTI
jgi:hypothetical protein